MNLDGQAPHILVVNDSPEILALLREIFEEEAFRVSTRLNEETDQEEIMQIAPNLIILDYSSESESGLLHQLTTNPRTEATPVILCTGAIREVEAVKPQLDMMGVGVVYKPFDIEQIIGAVRERLGLTSNSKNSLPPRLD